MKAFLPVRDRVEKINGGFRDAGGPRQTATARARYSPRRSMGRPSPLAATATLRRALVVLATSTGRLRPPGAATRAGLKRTHCILLIEGTRQGLAMTYAYDGYTSNYIRNVDGRRASYARRCQESQRGRRTAKG